MPFIQLTNAKYYYEEHGSGEETIVFSHGLLWSGHMFHKQVAYFKGRYRIITYDHRGQGQSEITPDGYDMDTLSVDAAELIEKLVGKPIIFAGLSMGGFVGMRLAARRPELIKKLILLETTAEPEPQENVGKYKMLNAIVKYIGFFPVVGSVMKIMFGQKFLNDANRIEEKNYWKNQLMSNNRKGITKAVDGVIYRKGIAEEIHKITCPTLIMVGDQDVATVPDKAKRIHSLIPNSKLVIFEGGGHTSSVEEPEVYNAEIAKFIS
ncbi:alpha/beta hydrolase fold containing protein [Emticicia oligotrophica DSM 17448]|uniref:Alpha/beta hydrolase fold containing protein n=1 Tax=Emticicia oligotrophica (strain DSM 17448 / CIP 109782 / MTCC 6937 / GPTSA100-15) TaxID=929562 RepID=A0ABN4ARL6_EMTOG|nr:alpha/beta hydrolase [Emticicia oligotrophica]AFK04989.1 alpha/beta hydrolase fold containing protein [Emticicia oligotrophica DSM 17448]